MIDVILFVGFPYVAVGLAVIVGAYRYFNDRFSYTSLSSQFMENRQLFWGSVPWHYGISIILLVHLLAVLFPGAWTALLGPPARLYVMEITGLALTLVTMAGLSLLILRRMRNSRLLVVTSVMDWVMLVALLAQVVLGFWVAFSYRWGSVWYAHTAAPWLISLLKFNPQIEYVTTLPLIPKLHFLSAFLVVALFPFTRLVHLVTFPITYLWRPYQVVIWNRRGRADKMKES
ncbi:MAG: respiratory nitrate reductase subunit gamma [Chloroflexi bacterium]|nr:respiratory nitrate reductase subunit gamma [Chloroflexota bacterium]